MSQDLSTAATRPRRTGRRTVAGSQPRRDPRACSVGARRAEDVQWAHTAGLSIVFALTAVGAVSAKALEAAEYNATSILVWVVTLVVLAGGLAAIIASPASVGRTFRPTEH